MRSQARVVKEIERVMSDDFSTLAERMNILPYFQQDSE